MLHGFPQWSAVFPAVGKCPRNSDSTHGVKPVRILHDLSLQSSRNLSPVPAEGHGIDTCADPLDPVCVYPSFQKSPRISVIFRMEQLVVIRVMQESRKLGDLSVASGLGLSDHHCVAPDPQGVLRVMASGITAEQLAYVGDRLFNKEILLFLEKSPFQDLVLRITAHLPALRLKRAGHCEALFHDLTRIIGTGCTGLYALFFTAMYHAVPAPVFRSAAKARNLIIRHYMVPVSYFHP